MVWPKVSIIWLNYNSIKIIDVVTESLESIANLDYPDDKYELIVVDNGSTDGSFDVIKSFLERKSRLKKKIIKLDKNLGFAEGNNVGYGARDKDSKYVVPVNNDAIIEANSVKLYVETFEKFPGVGALQGILVNRRKKVIDSIGLYLSNVFTAHPFSRDIKDVPQKYEGLKCSFVEGTFPAYRVESLKLSMGERIFEEKFLGFGEDALTSLMIWSKGFSTVFIPKVVGFHVRGATWRKIESIYLVYRNYLTMSSLFGGSTIYMYNLLLVLIHYRYRRLTPILVKESKNSTIR